MIITLPVRSEGQFQVEKIKKRNVITTFGRSHMMMTDGGAGLSVVIGSGTTPADENDSTLARPIPTTATHVSTSTTRSATPNENGEVWWRTSYRYRLTVDDVGGDVVIREVGTTRLGELLSRCVLDGERIVVTSGESIDVVWTYTEWVRAATISQVTLGNGRGDALGVVTAEVRPANFTNSSDINHGWMPVNNSSIPSSKYANSQALIGVAELSNLSIQPTFEDSVAASDRTANSVAFASGSGSFDGGVNCALINFGHTEWQIGFDPPIQKTLANRLTFNFIRSIRNL